MLKGIIAHILFCLVTLLLLMGQSIISRSGAVFGYVLFLSSFYTGRWICGQSYTASWLDMFRMFFLSFLLLDVVGLWAFVHYVEPRLRLTHYLESLINISVFTVLFLFSGFLIPKIRKGTSVKAIRREATE